VKTLINDNHFKDKIKKLPNPYGDGKAAEKAVGFLLEHLNK
jgi:UDP-N-acetylglucosamine 2-epimerase